MIKTTEQQKKKKSVKNYFIDLVILKLEVFGSEVFCSGAVSPCG